MTENNYTQIAVAGLVICLGALCFDLFGPKPSASRSGAARKKEEVKLEADTKRLRKQVSELQIKNDERLWSEPIDEVGPKAMTLLESFARQNNLKVISFRPQRVEEEAGLERMPYQISLEGSFPKVISFVRSVETPTTKIAVTNVQIASVDGASDTVSATIGLVAYREKTVLESDSK